MHDAAMKESRSYLSAPEVVVIEQLFLADMRIG